MKKTVRTIAILLGVAGISWASANMSWANDRVLWPAIKGGFKQKILLMLLCADDPAFCGQEEEPRQQAGHPPRKPKRDIPPAPWRHPGPDGKRTSKPPDLCDRSDFAYAAAGVCKQRRKAKEKAKE